MWDADEIDWWLCLFDSATERLVTEYLLVGVTESEIRDHFGIDPSVDPLDGVTVSEPDSSWLQTYLDGVAPNLMGCTASICVFAKGSD